MNNMSIYDKQIKDRVKNDERTFTKALADLSESVTSKEYSSEFKTKKEEFSSAINEVLSYFHIDKDENPLNFENFDADFDIYLKSKGLAKRAVSLKKGWYKKACGAYLSKTTDGDIVALVPSKFSGYKYFDKKTHKYKKVNKKNEHLFAKEAYIFTALFPNKKLNLKDLIVFSLKQISISDIVLAVLLTIIITVIGFLLPKINNLIYSNVIVDNSVSLLLGIFSTYFFISLSLIFLNQYKKVVLNNIEYKAGIALTNAAYMRVLGLPNSFYRKHDSGEILQMYGSIPRLVGSIFEIVLNSGITSLFSISYIAQMCTYARELVIPGLIIILCTIIISIINITIDVKYAAKRLKNNAKEVSLTYSLLSGINKIKMTGSEKRAFSKWANSYSTNAKLTYSPPFLLKYSSVLTLIASLVGTIVIYYFTITSNISLANYFAFSASYGIVSGAFYQFVSIGQSIASIKPTYNFTKPVLNTLPEDNGQKIIINNLKGNIELSHVNFAYDETTGNIINDLSLKIKSGEYVAIVGKTGCGKSTLMKLLLGFEKPTKGAIYFDGKDVSTLDLTSLRKRIGTVMQDGKLFSGDIYSNIVVTAPNLGLDDAWNAAELAGIKEDIEAFPMGMSTLISEDGGGISGGQKQRLMIARAIVFKPKILIFDEATSALDNITQKKISNSLDSLKCTRIVIAHRLSTIKNCDRIIVIDKGQIVEEGTYEELKNNKGMFYELVKKQELDESR